MWDEIIYLFLNFNGATVEVKEWISNFIPHFIMGVITYPCLKLIHVSKSSPLLLASVPAPISPYPDMSVTVTRNIEPSSVQDRVTNRGNGHNYNYHQVSDIRRTLVGNQIVDHSDIVVGASPVGAAPTTSPFSTYCLVSIYYAKTTAYQDEKHLSFVIWCGLYWIFYGIYS